MPRYNIEEIINYLSEFVTEQRLETFKKVLSNRTRYCTVVLEDIYQPHNASAVLRNCDCFGIQNIHIIEKRNKFKPDTEITMGADKWLTLKNYDFDNISIEKCITHLRSNGYRIVATTPHKNNNSLDQFDIAKGKFALLFGSELKGLTSYAIKNADEYLKIPMFGFTESLNVSVSTAIILQHCATQIRKQNIKWQLSDLEFNEILETWLRQSIKESQKIVERKFPS